MNRFKNVISNEQYMDDVSSSIFENIKKSLKRREESSIWGPEKKTLVTEDDSDSALRERKKLLDQMIKDVTDFRPTSVPPVRDGNRKGPEDENLSSNANIDESRPPNSGRFIKKQNFKRTKFTDHCQNNKKSLEKTSEEEMEKESEFSNEIELSEEQNYGKDFSDSVKQRCENSKSKKSNRRPVTNQLLSLELKSDGCKPKMNNMRISKSPEPDRHQVSEQILSQKYKSECCNPKVNNMKKSPDIQFKMPSANLQNNSKYTDKLNRRRIPRKVCIKISDERNEKSQELFIDHCDLLRIKKFFPKLENVLSDVDADGKTVQYCFEATNFIFGFIFFRKLPLDAISNASVRVEILAAIKEWEINKWDFQEKFFQDFLQNILPSSNICLVFSQASYYNLPEVCDACKTFAEESTALSSICKKKQKTCLITVSTYIEPTEMSIPFYPMEENFGMSFERHISNTVRFEALSGSFTIIGLQILLNNQHLVGYHSSDTLDIEYNTKCDNGVSETFTLNKPLRPINVIHFNKPLIVESKQTAEINIETDTKPYLCSAINEEIHIQKREKDIRFSVTVTSNYKIPKSGKNVYIVGKLLYHV